MEILVFPAQLGKFGTVQIVNAVVRSKIRSGMVRPVKILLVVLIKFSILSLFSVNVLQVLIRTEQSA